MPSGVTFYSKIKTHQKSGLKVRSSAIKMSHQLGDETSKYIQWVENKTKTNSDWSLLNVHIKYNLHTTKIWNLFYYKTTQIILNQYCINSELNTIHINVHHYTNYCHNSANHPKVNEWPNVQEIQQITLLNYTITKFECKSMQNIYIAISIQQITRLKDFNNTVCN